MVQTNKILTVSYGTFSCTLEGFDESFETMKAIAEYFRDLAQDDRYFGAEPPTPDAEMLARIAEKEISRRVEARFEDDGIVLRPSLAAETDTVTDPADTSSEATPAAPQDQPAEMAQPDPVLAEPEVPAPESVEPEAFETPTEVMPAPAMEALRDGMATGADVADDAEAQAQDRELDTASAALMDFADDGLIADQDAIEDAPAELAAVAQDEAPEEAPVATDMVEIAEMEEQGDAPAVAAFEDSSDEIAEDTTETVQDDQPAPVTYAPGEDPAIKAASPEKVPESIAEKLARIRAVVTSVATGKPVESAAPAEAPVEEPVETAEAPVDAPVDTAVEASGDTPVEAEADMTVSNIMSTLASGDADDTFVPAPDMTAAVAEDADDMPEADALDALDTGEEIVAETAAGEALDMDFDSAFVDDEEGLDAPDEAIEEQAEEAIEEHVEEAMEEAVVDLPAITAEEAEEEIAELAALDGHEAALDANETDAEAEAIDDAAEDTAEADADDEEVDAGAETAPEAGAAVAPRRVAPRRPVRVVKVKRRPAAIADTPTTAAESSLSDADEADLMRELAEVEAEFDEQTGAVALDDDTAGNIADVNDDTARTVRAMARRERRDSFAEDEGDVSRLLAETDEQLQEPEGRSRRNAIAHLRAAVAATRADRGSKDQDSGSDDPRDAYRDDLAQAVRPRRGVSEPSAERPRVAPLKLVAEQRVDLDEGEETPRAEIAAQAVRPRRVSMPVERDEDAEAGGFAAYAEEIGAARLPELLEAAAAYMSFVEGRDQFSRPQLMTKVRQVERGDSSREDRLRSFGQLLRDGKIEKVEGGRFTASDSIGFRPDKRAAG